MGRLMVFESEKLCNILELLPLYSRANRSPRESRLEQVLAVLLHVFDEDIYSAAQKSIVQLTRRMRPTRKSSQCMTQPPNVRTGPTGAQSPTPKESPSCASDKLRSCCARTSAAMPIAFSRVYFLA